jgi:opacity protein-like surface antigen
MVFANVVPQYRIPGTTLTPYAVAGVGYAFDSLGAVKSGVASPVYNLGLGTRVMITDNLDADLRWRNVRSMNGSNARVRDDHIFMVGASYKF